MIYIDPKDVKLSPRQKQVLLLLVQGLIDKEVGAKLGIDEGTANTHRKGLIDKFWPLVGFRPTIPDLVQIALALGYIKNKFEKKNPLR